MLFRILSKRGGLTLNISAIEHPRRDTNSIRNNTFLSLNQVQPQFKYF